MKKNFVITFGFEHETPEIDKTLKLVRDWIFEEPKVDIVIGYQNQKRQTVRQLIYCYHVAEEEDPIEENSHNIKIIEVEGEREVEGPKIDSKDYFVPLKINKVNIGIEEKSKIANIGYYLDNHKVERITELSCEYSDLFPMMFSNMKGVS
jgi:hypothetical protein